MGFAPTTSAGERPQTYALDRSATGTGNNIFYLIKLSYQIFSTFLHSVFYEIYIMLPVLI
jgi:hypothetical protein